MTVQKEVLDKQLLQKQEVVEMTIQNMQCDDCKKSYTPHKWKAQVQVRQKVDHKRTFLYLEQMILKHKQHKNCSNIAELANGLNFDFVEFNYAKAMVKFIQNSVTCKVDHSVELISHDE